MFDRDSDASSEVTVPDAEGEPGDDEIKMVLDKVNARRFIHAEHGEGLNSLEEEAINGFGIRLRHGSLGLVRLKEQATA